MVGSKKQFFYNKAGAGGSELFIMEGDESNYEDVYVAGGAHRDAGGEVANDVTPANVASLTNWLPRDGKRFEARCVIYTALSGQTKKIRVYSEEALQDFMNRNTANINVNITDPITNVVYALSDVKGQRSAVPREYDTGLDDGDAS